MATVAAEDLAAVGPGARSLPYLASKPVADPGSKKDLRTPKIAGKRPRTRSLALNPSRAASLTPTKVSGREKRARTRHLREKSPVIDLTTEVDFEVADPDSESPLKNATKPRRDLPTNVASGFLAANTPHDLNELPNPRLEHRPSTSTVDLNLSPIKKADPPRKYFASPTKLPGNLTIHPHFLSSPSKRRKTVAFSDNIASDAPSSPTLGEDPKITPKRSILKPVSEPVHSSPMDPNNSTMWVKTSHSILHQFSTSSHAPNNPEFWLPGTIIQLELKSSDLLQLVDGCVEVLRAPDFSRKFEVYATLNQIFKLNDAVLLSELFTGDSLSSSWLAGVEKSTGFRRKVNSPYINEICDFVTRDIKAIEQNLFNTSGNPKLSPSKNDPFEARSLSQALKLVSSLLSIPSINSCIPVNTVKWFYLHTCDMIVKPSISKSLVLPYLSIIKDCHFSAKKRKFIFESSPNPILERILFALLDIRNFVSSSLMNEKFIALKNLIQKFPAIMAKNFHFWFGGLVLNLCDVTFPLYTKVVSMGITALLETARNYLDDTDICRAARTLLELPLPTEQKSFTSENLVSISTMPLTVTIDYVSDSLKELIDNGHYKFAMDIWVGLTLLLGSFPNGIENWKHLQTWLQVHKYCFNGASINAKITALASWKVIIFKVCICEFRDLRHNVLGLVDSGKNGTENNSSNLTPNGKQNSKLEEALRPKIKLLIHIFINISSVEFQREIIDTLHHSFLSVLYNLLNSQQKTHNRMLLIYWDKIIQTVLMNFYFKKESSDSHMHHLGIGIFNRLVKPAAPINEKSFSAIRCLSHEAVTLSEINSLNPRWVYLRFDRMLPVLLTIFKLTEFDTDAKIGCLNNFLNTLKFNTKKEIQPSDATFDIIDSLPTALQVLFENSQTSYDLVFKLIVNLNDTFGASNLVLEADESPNVFDLILTNCIPNLVTQQLNAILSMLHGAIGERKSLIFLRRLAGLNSKFHREDLSQFVGDCLNSKKSLKFTHLDIMTVGKIFRTLDQNYAGIAKKLIQHIVLLKANEFEKMVDELDLAQWNIQIFKFFVTLMHDAPFDHLKKTSLKLMKIKWQSDEDFEEILKLLLESKFDTEIYSLRLDIVERLNKSGKTEWITIWKEYLESFEGETSKLDELMCLSVQLNIEFQGANPDQLKTLPLTKKAYDAKYETVQGESGSSQDKNIKNKVTAKQVELEDMIRSELRHSTCVSLKDNVTEEKKAADTSEELKSEQTIVLSSEPDQQSDLPEHKEEESKSTPKLQRKSDPAPATRRRSERLQSSASNPLKIIELSSDDRTDDFSGIRHNDAKSDASPIVETKRRTSTRAANAKANAGKTTSFSANEESIEDSLIGSEGSDGRKKRANESPSSSKTKKQKVEENLKQVSDLDDSLKKQQDNADLTSDLMEISSASSKSKKSDSDRGDSLCSLNCVDSQEQTTVASASDASDVVVHDSPLRKQLSIVEEVPGLESSSSHEFSGQVITDGPQIPGPRALKVALQAIGRSELAVMSFQEKYDLETAMLQLILRMRGQDEVRPA